MTEKAKQAEFLDLLNDNIVSINRICCIYIDNIEERNDLKKEICLQLWRSYS